MNFGNFEKHAPENVKTFCDNGKFCQDLLAKDIREIKEKHADLRLGRIKIKIKNKEMFDEIIYSVGVDQISSEHSHQQMKFVCSN